MDFDYSTYSLAPNAESRQPSPAREKPTTENYLRKTWIERCLKRNEQVVVTKEMLQYFCCEQIRCRNTIRENYCIVDLRSRSSPDSRDADGHSRDADDHSRDGYDHSRDAYDHSQDAYDLTISRTANRNSGDWGSKEKEAGARQ